MTKLAGSESESGSISLRHGSADPGPLQNVMDPQHWYLPIYLSTLRYRYLSMCLFNVRYHIYLIEAFYVFHGRYSPVYSGSCASLLQTQIRDPG
jgi:hypothetical protein